MSKQKEGLQFNEKMEFQFKKTIRNSFYKKFINNYKFSSFFRFDPASLRRLSWPQEKGIRKAGGGDGGEIVSEPIRVSWEGNQLVFPISESVSTITVSLVLSVFDHKRLNFS